MSTSSVRMVATMRSKRSSVTYRHQPAGNGSPGPIAARMFQVATRNGELAT